MGLTPEFAVCWRRRKRTERSSFLWLKCPPSCTDLQSWHVLVVTCSTCHHVGWVYPGVVAEVVERLDSSPFLTFLQPLRRLVWLGSLCGRARSSGSEDSRTQGAIDNALRRRQRVEALATGRARPSTLKTLLVKPWVWRSRKWYTVSSGSIASTALSE